MKHTPGPWKVDFAEPNAKSPCRILGDGEVARVTYRGRLAGDSWEANAGLIAAAPELLDRLEELVTVYEIALDGPDWKRRDHKLLDECRAIIARLETQP